MISDDNSQGLEKGLLQGSMLSAHHVGVALAGVGRPGRRGGRGAVRRVRRDPAVQVRQRLAGVELVGVADAQREQDLQIARVRLQGAVHRRDRLQAVQCRPEAVMERYSGKAVTNLAR